MKHSPNPYDALYSGDDDIEISITTAQDLIGYADNFHRNYISGDFDLAECIGELKREQMSFVRIGLLAYKIKVYRIYKKAYSSFQDFCERALEVSHWQINRTIEAARVVLELAVAGFEILPKCESQCRPLYKILANFGLEELLDNWQRVIDSLKPNQITAKSICEVLGMESKDTHIRVDRDLAARLQKKAASEGKSVRELLEEIVEEEDEVEEVEEEKLANWQTDLELLVEEEDAKQPTQQKYPSSFGQFSLARLWQNLIADMQTIFYQVQFLT